MDAITDVVKAINAVKRGVKELPKTGDEIADLFETQGITGRLGSMAACPLANYLSDYVSSCGVPCDITVDTGQITLDSDDYGVNVATPEHLGEFVKNFDAGQYPFLVDAKDDDPWAHYVDLDSDVCVKHIGQIEDAG